MVIEKAPENRVFKFKCNICHYKCSRNSEYMRHLMTRKHLGNASGNPKITDKNIQCKKCNKIYKSKKGLWSHTKRCNFLDENSIEENLIIEENKKIIENHDIKALTDLVMDLVKSNHGLQTQMLELCKNTNTNNININQSNSHNKTFNLQVFLNEECKDAMNMSEFIKSIVLQSSDLLDIGNLGYVEGISKIILKEMNGIERNKRPMHCTDAKRDVLYIKDENKWEKESPDNPKLMHAIREIEQKNIGVFLNEWMPNHPDHRNSESSENNEYLKLMKETMNGSEENINKVIRRIAKEVVIDKY
jgi:hypothetical protein